MIAHTAGDDLIVMLTKTTECQHQVGVLSDIFVVCNLAVLEQIKTQNMWHDDFCCCRRIGIYRASVATQRIEEPMQLTLRMVETPRTTPSIRATKNSLVAAGLDGLRKCLRRQIKSTFPTYRSETFQSPAIAVIAITV